MDHIDLTESNQWDNNICNTAAVTDTDYCNIEELAFAIDNEYNHTEIEADPEPDSDELESLLVEVNNLTDNSSQYNQQQQQPIIRSISDGIIDLTGDADADADPDSDTADYIQNSKSKSNTKLTPIRSISTPLTVSVTAPIANTGSLSILNFFSVNNSNSNNNKANITSKSTDTDVNPTTTTAIATAAASITEIEPSTISNPTVKRKLIKPTLTDQQKWKFLLTGHKPASATAVKSKSSRHSWKTQPTTNAANTITETESKSINNNNTNSSDDRINRYGQRYGSCPYHKRIAGSNIIVDGFQYTKSILTSVADGITINPSWFLSHFHSDHTVGLNKNWNSGLIYCSIITGRLLIESMGIESQYIQLIPLNNRILINGFYCTLIDANHCPGAVIFIFELPPFADTSSSSIQSVNNRLNSHGPVYIHCGDFRYHSSMKQLFIKEKSETIVKSESLYNSASVSVSTTASAFSDYPSLNSIQSLRHLSELTITGVYLDTTYCQTQYNFPSQIEAVNTVLNIVSKALEMEEAANTKYQLKQEKLFQSTVTKSEQQNLFQSVFQSIKTRTVNFLTGYTQQQLQSTLFLVGSYQIGKEKVYLEIARQFNMKIYVQPYRKKMLKMLELFDDKYSDQQDNSIKQQHNNNNWTSDSILTTDISESRLHVVPLGICSHKSIGNYINPLYNSQMKKIQSIFTSVIVFRPTGWVGNTSNSSDSICEISIIEDSNSKNNNSNSTNTIASIDKIKNKLINKQSDNNSNNPSSSSSSSTISPSKVKVYPKRSIPVTVYGIPYSEHSTYRELQEFITVLSECGLQTIIPTVTAWKGTEIVEKHFKHLIKQK